MKTNDTPANTPSRGAEFSRRQFLQKTALGTAGAVIASQFAITRQALANELPSRKNILLIITDQERPPMWFPPKWAEGDPTAIPPIPANLPNTQRLVAHGLTFDYAFTAAAMCTAARNTLFTGLFPAQHRSDWTLTEDTDQALEEHQLDPTLPNLATCLKEAGYDVFYKGKWHLSKRFKNADGTFTEDDLSRYGFEGWDAPDAGGDARIENFGGADALNTIHSDQRFVDDAVNFLTNRVANPTDKPFCLVVSLVNPHDVLSYPMRYVNSDGTAVPGGYKDGYGDTDPWIAPTTPPIDLPPTVHENLLLNGKPAAQEYVILGSASALGPLDTPGAKRDYLNYYGRLMTAVDKQIGQLLDVLDPAGDGTGQGFRDTLVIRTSDHGEMAMCHGGMRQKTMVAYEEVVRVPLIWSNPELFPQPKTTQAMVSHVDFLPTLCALTGVTGKHFKGKDYSNVILDPDSDPSPTAVQDYVLFTFDDIYAGQDRAVVGSAGIAPPPNRIQMVRTPDYKLVRYYDAAGVESDDGEFYDLTPGGGDYYANDGSHGSIVYSSPAPLELENLRYRLPVRLSPAQEAARTELLGILATAQQTTLAPQGTDDTNSPAPTNLKVEVKRWTDDDGQAQARVQVSFLTRENETYQLQRSANLTSWDDVPNVVCGDDPGNPSSDPSKPVKGNNGPVAFCDELTTDKVYYRLLQATMD